MINAIFAAASAAALAPAAPVPAPAVPKPQMQVSVGAPIARPRSDAARLRSRAARALPVSAAERRVRAANRAATREPATNAYLDAVQVYPFAEGAIFHVVTAPGQVTDVALEPGETLGAVAAGDTARWIVADTSSGSGDGRRTHVLIKPFAAGLNTNVLIATDRRTYHLSLSSSANAAMSALSWTYPQGQLIAWKAAQEQSRASQPLVSGLRLDQLHFDYVISGDQPAWRPLRAFDDGQQSFIEFPASLAVGEAPPLFLIDAKGDAQLVNYRVQGRFYIVDRLFDAAELRLGLKHQNVVRIARGGADAPRRAS